tara:strand:+ start:512 stop:1165 length:654 start_codon:yes stop_codon:yes gene_type:complete
MGGSGMRTRRFSGGDGLAMPDPDDDEAGPLATDSPIRHARTLVGSLWWLITSVALVAVLMSGDVPWWLQLVAAAEAYASLRRVIVRWMSVPDAATAAPGGHVGSAARRSRGGEVAAPAGGRPGRVKHFVSLSLTPTAPADEIVARLLALDSLPCVRTIEFGTNVSPEGKSRGHTHGFLITFDDIAARDAYLTDPEHVAFGEYAGAYIEDVYVFDFIS